MLGLLLIAGKCNFHMKCVKEANLTGVYIPQDTFLVLGILQMVQESVEEVVQLKRGTERLVYISFPKYWNAHTCCRFKDQNGL